MKDSTRLALFFGLALGLIYCLQTMQQATSQPPIPPYTPVEFDWYESRGDAEKDDWLIVRYDDGRIICVKIAAASMSKFFPQATAAKLGLPAPFIEFYAGGQSVRVDLPDDAEAERLYREMFPTKKELADDQ